MALFGIHEDELACSNALAWLLDPAQPHGLGSAILDDFLSATWSMKHDMSGRPKLDFDNIRVRREVVGDESRSDILIEDKSRTFVCVIENKILAEETDKASVPQTTRLYENFRHYAPNSLFVFLTPTAKQPQCKQFVPFSYPSLASILIKRNSKHLPERTGIVLNDVSRWMNELGSTASFKGFSEEAELYIRYVEDINRVSAAWLKEHDNLVRACEDRIKELYGKTEVRTFASTSEVEIWWDDWWPNAEKQHDNGVEFDLWFDSKLPRVVFTLCSYGEHRKKFSPDFKKRLDSIDPSRFLGIYEKKYADTELISAEFEMHQGMKNPLEEVVEFMKNAIDKFKPIVDNVLSR